MKNILYEWWKQKPSRLRRPLVFVFGILLALLSPVVGSIPGPGGIALFTLAIAILASEFDWAQQVKSFVLEKVPKKVTDNWRPTPRWQFVFDVSGLALLICSMLFYFNSMWAPATSFGFTGLCIVLFNRQRLERLKKFFRKPKK